MAKSMTPMAKVKPSSWSDTTQSRRGFFAFGVCLDHSTRALPVSGSMLASK